MGHDLTLYSRAGEKKFNLYSRGSVCTVTKASQKQSLLADDTVSLGVTSAHPLDITLGDYITIFGRRYTVNQLPQPTKQGERAFTYEITLEGLQYALIDIYYQLPADAYGETYYGNLQRHLDILGWNINRLLTGWSITLDPEAWDPERYENITASGKNALAMLQELCELFAVEFEVSPNRQGGGTIAVKKKIGVTHPFTLEYGRGRGLYQISRANVNNAGITNRLYVYGSGENLPQRYGHTKLCLEGCDRLSSYVEDAESVTAYGVKEGEKTYSDIKAERTGTVTALGPNRQSFIDSSGDPNDQSNLPMFDLNEKDADGNTKYLIEGSNAKIKFQTGNLAGYEFDLHSYDHATRTFVINRFTDETGTVMPGDTPTGERPGAFNFAEGDKYIITGIQLPEAYVKQAQARLRAAALADFANMTQPQVSYKLQLAEDFFSRLWGKTTAEVLHPGDFIHITDGQIGVDKEVRITEITRDLLRLHSYEITLSDTVFKSGTVRIYNELSDIKEIIAYNSGIADPAKARRRWQASQEVLNMVFDQDGKYYTEKIRPLSIETDMLSVGAKAAQFTLNNVTIQPNLNGDPNAIAFSAGLLVHYGINEDAPRTWVMIQSGMASLSPAKAYYIFAKCPRTMGAGSFILSPTPIKCEADPGWYYFLVGVLNSVDAGTDRGGRAARLISLTYGSSTVNGRFIRCGRIESSGGGATYFDLDSGVICGKIKFIGTDGAVKDITDLEAGTSELHNYVNSTLQGILTQQQNQIDGITNQLDGVIETFFASGVPSLTTHPASNWSTDEDREKHLGDLYYNNDTGVGYRFSKDGTTFKWVEVRDTGVTEALAAAARAQDTADGKRRVFVSRPVPPYDKGDLWASGTFLRRCVFSRASGTFFAMDWDAATNYDATQTAIDGGIVTAGTVQLANEQTAAICAGITGGRGREYSETASTPANEKVRIWAGASEGNRTAAPFRVLENGKVYATNAEVEGTVKSASGQIGGWQLHDGRLTSTDQDSEGKKITPAVELNAALGQLKAADSVVMDADGFNLMRDGYSMVKVANVSVGDYCDNLLRKEIDRTASPQSFIQRAQTYYLPPGSSGAKWNPYRETVIPLGFFERGSQIFVDECSISFNVPANSYNASAAVYLTITRGLRVRLLRDGSVVRQWKKTSTETQHTNGTITLKLNPALTHIIGPGEAGSYSLVIDSPGTWIWDSAAAASLEPFHITTTARYKFVKGNFKRTLMGYDGLLSTWDNGYMFLNGSAFVVKFGAFALKVDTTGLKKSADGGQTWGNL